MSKCVLRDWVLSLNLQMQGTLICAMRGPDNLPKECSAKKLIRAFRAVLTNNALPLGPKNTFAGDGSEIADQEDVDGFFSSIDEYPHHWHLHFVHAVEIIGYFHPDATVANLWLKFYLRSCRDFHMNPETKEQLAFRSCGNGCS